MKMNNEMLRQLSEVEFSRRDLPPELIDIAGAGFVECDGCRFLSVLKGLKTNASADDFPDRTGFECFINSVHIDDYVNSDYLKCACFFLTSVFRVWSAMGVTDTLQGIISTDEFGSLVKIHVLRSGESWVGDDLERYEDALLVVTSEDAEFLERFGSGTAPGALP